MSFTRKGLRSRCESRRKLSRNQAAAKERKRRDDLSSAEVIADRLMAEADQWARDNPPPKRKPAAYVRIVIPGLPTKSIRVSRWPGGQVLAGNRFTTCKQLGRKIGMLLEQFLP